MQAGYFCVSIPYFPLYPDDFEADTAHLTLAEDGAYNRLLRLCWRSPECKIPADQAWIFRRMRAATDADRATVNAVLREFFVTKGGKIWSARLLEEYTQANAAHQRRILAGSAGGFAKALNAKKKTPSNAVALAYQPEPEPEPVKKEAKASQKSHATRLSADWFLPVSWGEWAMAEGFSADTIRTEADNFKDYWNARAGLGAAKLDWQATWRVWMRKLPKGKTNGHGRNHDAGETPGDRELRIIAAAARTLSA
jgi:uncharacterized protein YdaU (DUF1376 family)